MDDKDAAIDLSGASWEQFIGAMLRLRHFEILLATARPRCRPPVGGGSGPHVRGSFLAMFAITILGFALL